jgi:rSAM/selenodomain-associated transferase 2
MSAAAPGGPLASIVVPVLDEERGIGALLDHVAALPGRWEVLLADGGSRDATVAIARAHPLAPRLVAAPRGRARQQNAAAALARGDVLVFLHADSRLPPTAYASLCAALERGAQAGNFTLRFAGGGVFAAALTAVYALQRRLGVFYGDSTIWATPACFARLGGFPDLPIMEDYALARALARHVGAARLPGPATTSPRRWRALGVPRTVLSWILIRWLFVAGVPAERLARFYRPIR